VRIALRLPTRAGRDLLERSLDPFAVSVSSSWTPWFAAPGDSEPHNGPTVYPLSLTTCCTPMLRDVCTRRARRRPT